MVKDEMSSPDITAPSRLSLGGTGKQSDGEGGHGFRCKFAPNLDAYIDLNCSPPPVPNSLREHIIPFEAFPVRIVPA